MNPKECFLKASVSMSRQKLYFKHRRPRSKREVRTKYGIYTAFRLLHWKL